MIQELLKDSVKLALIVGCLYGVLWTCIRQNHPAASTVLQGRRLAILLVLVLGVLAIKVTEDVLGDESGPIDNAILVFIHTHLASAWTAVFQAITLTGSMRVLLPAVCLATVVLWLGRHRQEAILLAASALTGAGLVYAVKSWVGRARPSLWPSDWYAGSSFPSGHTLAVAAVATAGALSVLRLRPRLGTWAVGMAVAWTTLVALSRLVLGVHWPTDVLAAACIGAAIPLFLSVAMALRPGGSTQSSP